jgi:outer membrane lipoprotein-sorting protein
MSEVPARWSGAAVAARPAERRAQLASLPSGTPPIGTLFTFMRDAELRFSTLRLRIEERTWTAGGETTRTHEVLVRHPGRVRITVRRDDLEMPRDHEVWVSDGTTITTYSAIHDVTTVRPARRHLVGLESPDLPGTSRVYRPLTPLPPQSVADLALHPAGFCQNVLETGDVRVTGSGRVAGREAVTLVADHPRTSHLVADRPDRSLEVAVDAELGLITRLVERLGARVTRHVEAIAIETDLAIPDSAFEIAISPTAHRIY